MLKVENISTGYGKKQVLFDISFELNEGEIVLIAGSNGSGKSTLLKAIYRLLPLWNSTLEKIKGSVIFDGENITNQPTATLLKKGLLYIPQKNNLFEDLTVIENLGMAGITLDPKLLKQRIENALSIFTTLVPHLKRIPMKLSGGERSLLTLAMATLHQPKVILIDEPLIGLSPINITFITEILKTLNEKSGISFLIVEHRVKECILIADKIIGLKLGKVFCKIAIDTTFNINELNLVYL